MTNEKRKKTTSARLIFMMIVYCECAYTQLPVRLDLVRWSLFAFDGDLWVINMRCVYHLPFESSEKFRYNRQSLARFIQQSRVWYRRARPHTQVENRVANLWHKIVYGSGTMTASRGNTAAVVTASPSAAGYPEATATTSHRAPSIVKMHGDDDDDDSTWMANDAHLFLLYL